MLHSDFPYNMLSFMCKINNFSVSYIPSEDQQKGAQVEEEGESSKSVKTSVPSQRDKAAAR